MFYVIKDNSNESQVLQKCSEPLFKLLLSFVFKFGQIEMGVDFLNEKLHALYTYKFNF